MLRKVSFPYFL